MTSHNPTWAGGKPHNGSSLIDAVTGLPSVDVFTTPRGGHSIIGRILKKSSAEQHKI
jgi:hypothetical protein